MKNKYKIIIIPILLLVIFLICFFITTKFKNLSNEIENDITSENYYNTYTYVTEAMINNCTDLTKISLQIHEYTPKFMKENSDAIAIVSIISKDGASMEYSTFGMTYGKMLINNVILGEVKQKEIIEYLKPGGIISVKDYDEHDNKAAVEKRDYLNEKAGKVIDKENTYFNIKLEDDIEIEEGKTYLAYLHYIEKYDKYEIIGLGNGLREVNIEKQERIKEQEININELKIKNNRTQEWESLKDYIDNYIR